LEELQTKMIKQFRTLLGEYERLLIGYIGNNNKEKNLTFQKGCVLLFDKEKLSILADQNRTKFEKVFEENEILKKKATHYETEYNTLKAKYETINSAHQQALRVHNQSKHNTENTISSTFWYLFVCLFV
jgi:hypothetical protein